VLGLAAVKPQLWLFVPLALVAAGLWRSLGAAAATALALMLVSSAAFGWTIWLDWAAALPRLSETLADIRPHMLTAMPTVEGNFELLGTGSHVAFLAQFAAGGVAAWAVWRAFRKGPSRTAIAALLCAAILATPYALIGDLPFITAAVVLLAQDRLLAGRTFRTVEIAVLGLAIWLPYLMIGFRPFPLSAAMIGALLAMAVSSRLHEGGRGQLPMPAG
jgi:hypothetical protein